jgi:hypothetical protein
VRELQSFQGREAREYLASVTAGVNGRDIVDDDSVSADGRHGLRGRRRLACRLVVGRLALGAVLLPDEDAPVPGRRASAGPTGSGNTRFRKENPALQEDRERQVRGAAASQEVAGLAELGGRGRQLACLRLVEAELAELLGTPAEDVNLLVEKRRLLRGCGAT